MSEAGINAPEHNRDARVEGENHTAASASLGAEEFKRAFRLYAAGVAIVAADTPQGPTGLTISSLASVSAAPPVISFSVSSTGDSALAVLEVGSYTVNLVSERHSETAAAFAVSGSPRFTPEQGWKATEGGHPALCSSPAVLHCRTRQCVDLGQSILIVADVLHTTLTEGVEPLVYYDRTFRKLGTAA